jgi:mannosyltransferase OCH1-like enzyme
MNISQILITDTKSEYPQYIAECLQSVRALFPEANHCVYDEPKIIEFIGANFDESVLNAFNRLIPNAYKADLGRYCLLYKLGGWYFDIAIRPFRRIDFSDDIDLFAFRDFGLISQVPYSVANGIVYSKKYNPVLKTAIELVVKNCELNFYGVNALCPTGPNLFGQAIASHGSNIRNLFGDVLFLTPLHGIKNKAFVLPDGEIFGFFKPADGGDLTQVGIQGSNNYVSLYSNRNIYKK